jgi:hypothetical protein
MNTMMLIELIIFLSNRCLWFNIRDGTGFET